MLFSDIPQHETGSWVYNPIYQKGIPLDMYLMKVIPEMRRAH